MNSEEPAVVEVEHHDLKEVPGAVGSQVQGPGGTLVFGEGVHDQGVLNGVADILVQDAVLPGCTMNLHTERL